jgi:septal ring factor EnvC (AmiA/AmiB activator)
MPSRDELWSRSRDVITIILLPFAIWVASSLSDLQHSIIRLEVVDSQIEKLEKKVDAQGDVDAEFRVQVTRLETKLEGISSDLVEIKEILRRMSSK